MRRADAAQRSVRVAGEGDRGLGFEIVADPNAPSLSPSPRPTGFWPTVRFIAQTRKGIGTMMSALSSGFVAAVFMVGITVSYWQGKLTPDAYWARLQIVGGGLTAVWTLLGMIYVGGTAYEDGQEKAGPKTVAVASSESTTTDPK